MLFEFGVDPEGDPVVRRYKVAQSPARVPSEWKSGFWLDVTEIFHSDRT